MPRNQALQQGPPMDWMQRIKPFLIVVAAIGLAVLLHIPLNAVWGGRFPFMAFFPAILVVTLLCGWRYGALAALLAALAVYLRREAGADLLFITSIGIFLV